MGEAHAAGLTHGALHAASLVLDGDDIVVPDLASPRARAARDAVYAAPEIRVGAAAGPAADVFALCMLLRRLLDRADAPLPALEEILRRGTARGGAPPPPRPARRAPRPPAPRTARGSAKRSRPPSSRRPDVSRLAESPAPVR